MSQKKVLFVCIHNSARSQMAEKFLNHLGGDFFQAESAGIEPGTLNPLVIKAMHEIGLDISYHQTKSVYTVHESGKKFDLVITVCDPEAAEKCPIFPGESKRLHWGFQDPSSIDGSEEEKLRTTRHIRDQIKLKIEKFIQEYQ